MCFLGYRPKFGPDPFCFCGLRAQTAIPCIGPSTGSWLRLRAKCLSAYPVERASSASCVALRTAPDARTTQRQSARDESSALQGGTGSQGGSRESGCRSGAKARRSSCSKARAGATAACACASGAGLRERMPLWRRWQQGRIQRAMHHDVVCRCVWRVRFWRLCIPPATLQRSPAKRCGL